MTGSNVWEMISVPYANLLRGPKAPAIHLFLSVCHLWFNAICTFRWECNMRVAGAPRIELSELDC